MALLIWLGATCVKGQDVSENKVNPNIVPTYECAGIYWNIPEEGACKLRYKENNETQWREGLDLVYDARDGEYRGSIVGLKPNTCIPGRVVCYFIQNQFGF